MQRYENEVDKKSLTRIHFLIRFYDSQLMHIQWKNL